MNHAQRFAAVLVATLGWSTPAEPTALALGAAANPTDARVETAELTDGSKVVGKVVVDPKKGLVFLSDGNPTPIAFDRVRQILFAVTEPDNTLGAAPFRIQLGSTGRLSGRLVRVDRRSVELDPGLGRPTWKIDRRSVTGILQRPGEVQILDEDFAKLDPTRWSQTGSPQVITESKTVPDHALKLPSGGSSVTTRLPKPLGSGRVEIAYRDSATRAAGHRWFLDLTFRKGSSDLSTIRIIPGWAEDTLAVETPGGPPLPIQPLNRKDGKQRLAVQFDGERTAVTVDGNDLAHGRAIGGPLVEIRIATEATGTTQPPDGLSAVIEDLRVIRLVEPTGHFEVEPRQDEVRLVSGDQLFGSLLSSTPDGLELSLDNRNLRLPWSEVAEVHLLRVPAASAPVTGIWVEAEWRSPGGVDPQETDRVEAVFAEVDGASFVFDVPHVGRIGVPRGSMRRIAPQGRSTRILVDPNSHHLGDRQAPEFDPPQPETAPLVIAFDLQDALAGSVTLVLDVSKAISEHGSDEFSQLVKQGQLRTTVTLNARKLGDLNTHVAANNEKTQRIQIEIPSGLLKAGRNTLNFDQIGTLAEPKLRDNLGIERIMLELPSASRDRP